MDRIDIEYLCDLWTKSEYARILTLIAFIYHCGYFQLSWWIPVCIGYVMLHSHWTAVSDIKTTLEAKHVHFDQNPNLLQQLLKNQNIPKWIQHGEWEKCRFLNNAVRMLWPHLNVAVEKSLREALPPLLQEVKPLFLSKLELGAVNLGSVPLKVLSVKVLEEAIDEVIWDLQLSLSGGDATIAFSAGNKVVSLSAVLENIQIKGTLRIIFGRLLGEWPLFNSLRIAFIEPPSLKYKLKAGKVPLNNIPGFVPWLTDLIQDSLSESLVWPNEYVLNLDELWTVPVDPPFSPQPKGVLTVRIIEAKNLQNKDLFGKSDPMALVWINQKLPKLKTRKIHGTLNPVWDEVFEFTVFHKDTERLHINIENINFGVMKNEPLGNITIHLNELKPGLTHTQWYKLRKIRSGSIHIELFYRPFIQKQSCSPRPMSLLSTPKNLDKDDRSTHSTPPTTPTAISKSFALALGKTPDNSEESDDDERSQSIISPLPSQAATASEPGAGMTRFNRTGTSIRRMPKLNNTKIPQIPPKAISHDTSIYNPMKKNKGKVSQPLADRLKLSSLQLQREKGSPDIDRTFDAILRVRVLSARNLKARNRDGTSDPFVLLRLGERYKLKTSIKKKTKLPVWNEEFHLKVKADEIQRGVLEVTVKDYDKWTKNSILGTLQIYVVDIMKADAVINRQYHLSSPTDSGNGTGSDPTIHLEMELLSVYSASEIQQKNNSNHYKEPEEASTSKSSDI